jgi:hypothetical protein
VAVALRQFASRQLPTPRVRVVWLFDSCNSRLDGNVAAALQHGEWLLLLHVEVAPPHALWRLLAGLPQRVAAQRGAAPSRFRLLMTCHHNRAPAPPLLRRCVPLLLQPPQGVRLCYDYAVSVADRLPVATSARCESSLWRQLQRRLLLLHMALRERGRYGACGWAAGGLADVRSGLGERQPWRWSVLRSALHTAARVVDSYPSRQPPKSGGDDACDALAGLPWPQLLGALEVH